MRMSIGAQGFMVDGQSSVTSVGYNVWDTVEIFDQKLGVAR